MWLVTSVGFAAWPFAKDGSAGTELNYLDACDSTWQAARVSPRARRVGGAPLALVCSSLVAFPSFLLEGSSQVATCSVFSPTKRCFWVCSRQWVATPRICSFGRWRPKLPGASLVPRKTFLRMIWRHPRDVLCRCVEVICFMSYQCMVNSMNLKASRKKILCGFGLRSNGICANAVRPCFVGRLRTYNAEKKASWVWDISGLHFMGVAILSGSWHFFWKQTNPKLNCFATWSNQPTNPNHSKPTQTSPPQPMNQRISQPGWHYRLRWGLCHVWPGSQPLKRMARKEVKW